MPQAIKKFNGSLTASGNYTHYTCPSNTLALVLPSITMKNASGSTARLSIGWNSSSVASNDDGNLHYVLNHNTAAQIACFDKYDIRASFSSSAVHFNAGFATFQLDSNVYQFYLSTTNTKYINTSGGDVGPSFPTGPWAMTAGDKLSINVNNSNLYVGYNYLIIEEAV